LACFRFVSILVVVAAMTAIILQRIPPQDSPFAPLDLQHPIGLATGMKLDRLHSAPERCLQAIARAPVAVSVVPDRRMGDDCAFETVVRLDRSSVRWWAPVSVTCAMAAALVVWEREIVAPAAARHFGSRVVSIDHLGSYACRRVYGSSSPSARVSQHATANAIDVAGFRLADGTRVTLARDWATDTAKGAFLRDVRDGSCRLFKAVLGPAYNQAHADHFHLDMGPYAVCR
jgi:Uncharacterized protein conserved in bacteria